MDFKRYEGTKYSVIQNKADKNLPKCPFCGQTPHWLFNIKGGFNAATVCKCEKCGGQLYSEEGGVTFGKKFRVVGIGCQNRHDLQINSVYDIKTLNNLDSYQATDNQSVVDNATNFGGGETCGGQMSNGNGQPQSLFQSATVPSKPNKKLMSIIVWVVMAIMVLMVFLILYLPNDKPSDPTANDLETVSEPTISVVQLYGYYNVTIKGKVKNTSSETMDYVYITFAIYDEKGNVIDNAFCNQLDLEPGQTWAYSATTICDTNRPVSCKITDIVVR